MHNLLWNIALSTLLILSPSWLYFESKCQAWYDLICAKSDIKPQPTNPESKCWPSASYFPLLCWFSCHVNVLHLLQIKEKYATNRSSAYCLIATGATLLQCSVQNKTLSTHTHTRAHTTVLWPFYRDHAGELVPRKELRDFMVQGKINSRRHIDHPAGRHSIRTDQCPLPTSTIPPYYFTGQMPFLPPNQQRQSTEGN